MSFHMVWGIALCLAMPFLLHAQLHRYEYVFPDGFIYVYDIDNGFNLVKTVQVPTRTGVRGAVASAATGMLYISYGTDMNPGGSLLKYDLKTDQVVWTMTYPFGIDSMSISPDGKTIYMPTGELYPGGLWEVIDADSGKVVGAIDSGGEGPHNTVVSADGRRVYMGPRSTNFLVVADTATGAIVQRIGPVQTSRGSGVRPFTINRAETLAFITATGLLGFQVGDIATGKMLYTVPVRGFSWDGTGITAPSHGISISPDEKEIYVVDAPNSYVHVYDISGLPGSAPKQVADIQLVGKMTGTEQLCAYDCIKDGWLQHSNDGRYVFVGDSGDVIDTRTRTTVTTLPVLGDTRKFIEIDFQDGAPVWGMMNRSSTPGNLGGVVNAASYASGAVSPGELVYLSGAHLGPATLAGAVKNESGGLATSVGDTQVLFDGVAAPVVYSSNSQASAIAPYEVAGKSVVTVQVSYKGVRSNPMVMEVADAAPGLFTADATGRGQGAILNQDGGVNGPSNPAPRNSVVQVFGTGEGLNDPQLDTGAIASGLHNAMLPVTATVGGKPAAVEFAGSASGEVAGVLQVNVVIPGDAPSGANEIIVTVGTKSTQAGVTVAVL